MNGILKKIAAIAVAVAVTLTAAACGNAAITYDKDAAIKKAYQVVDAANKRDYQGIWNMLPESMQKQVSADELKKSWDGVLNDSGRPVGSDLAQSDSMTDKGVNYIVVVVTVKYEKATRIFTISLTKDMQIAGLYMK